MSLPPRLRLHGSSPAALPQRLCLSSCASVALPHWAQRLHLESRQCPHCSAYASGCPVFTLCGFGCAAWHRLYGSASMAPSLRHHLRGSTSAGSAALSLRCRLRGTASVTPPPRHRLFVCASATLLQRLCLRGSVTTAPSPRLYYCGSASAAPPPQLGLCGFTSEALPPGLRLQGCVSGAAPPRLLRQAALAPLPWIHVNETEVPAATNEPAVMAAADKPEDPSAKERPGVQADANKPMFPAAADKVAVNPVANIPRNGHPRDGSSAVAVVTVTGRPPWQSSISAMVIASRGGRPRSGCPGDGCPCVPCGGCVPSPQWTSLVAPGPTHPPPPRRRLRLRPPSPVLAPPPRLQPPSHLRSCIPAPPRPYPCVLMPSCPRSIPARLPVSPRSRPERTAPLPPRVSGGSGKASLRLRPCARVYTPASMRPRLAHEGRNATTESGAPMAPARARQGCVCAERVAIGDRGKALKAVGLLLFCFFACFLNQCSLFNVMLAFWCL